MKCKRNFIRTVVFGIAAAGIGLVGSAGAQEKKTVAYLAPSLDISYWQWVGYGVKEKAK